MIIGIHASWRNRRMAYLFHFRARHSWCTRTWIAIPHPRSWKNWCAGAGAGAVDAAGVTVRGASCSQASCACAPARHRELHGPPSVTVYSPLQPDRTGAAGAGGAKTWTTGCRFRSCVTPLPADRHDSNRRGPETVNI